MKLFNQTRAKVSILTFVLLAACVQGGPERDRAQREAALQSAVSFDLDQIKQRGGP